MNGETKGTSGRACFFLSYLPDPHLKRRVASTVQTFLSINRPDLAKAEYQKAKKWVEDNLLLQLIESTIDLVTGEGEYPGSNPFYTERLANRSVFDEAVRRSRCDEAITWGSFGGEVGSGGRYQSRGCG